MPRVADPIDKHVGQRIRMQRKLRGFSQQNLATALGLTFQQIQKYEKGTNRVGSSRLIRIAAHLGVAPAYFYEGIEGATAADAAPSEEGALITAFCSTAGAGPLMKAFIAIADQPDRHLVVRMAERMAKIARPAAFDDVTTATDVPVVAAPVMPVPSRTRRQRAGAA